jgi:hypothetical protein
MYLKSISWHTTGGYKKFAIVLTQTGLLGSMCIPRNDNDQETVIADNERRE